MSLVRTASLMLLPVVAACGSAPTRAPIAAARPVPRDACPTVAALAGEACTASRFAWVYGAPDELAPAVAEIDEAAEAFHRHFGAYPKRGAVVLLASPAPAARDQLVAAGADWVLPMVSSAALMRMTGGAASGASPGLAELLRPQIRQQLEAQLGAAAVTDELVEGAVTQAVAQASGRGTSAGATAASASAGGANGGAGATSAGATAAGAGAGAANGGAGAASAGAGAANGGAGAASAGATAANGGAGAASAGATAASAGAGAANGGAGATADGAAPLGEMNVLGHELGHVWFIRLVEPGAAWDRADDGDHYGGALPDWLDETAAVLMENAALTDNRRTAFRADLAAGRTVALPALFAMAHPALDSAEVRDAIAQAEHAGATGPRVIVLRANPADTAGAAAFYHQCRSIADFLIARTDDDRVFLDIATALREGATMDSWLALNAGRYRLPPTLAELDSEWRAWAATR